MIIYDGIKLKGWIKFSADNIVVFDERKVRQLEDREVQFFAIKFLKNDLKFILNAGKYPADFILEYDKVFYKNGNSLHISYNEYKSADYFIFNKKFVLKVVDFDTFVYMIKIKL